MGNVLKTPEPVHRVLATRTGYELRAYESYLVAEVDASGGDSQAFRTLANYIGVFTGPQNKAPGSEKGEAISMTAPVIMPAGPTQGEQIQMTAPVVTASTVMQFVMPDKYKELSQLPTPLDSRVSLKQVEGKCVGVIRYSGYANRQNVQQKLGELLALLRKDSLLGEEDPPEGDWVFCGYDPPFKPGPFRRNEVWVNLHMSEEQIKSKLAASTA